MTTTAPTCPECGCELTPWMNGRHAAGCTIGAAEDSLRLHDMNMMTSVGQNTVMRVIWPHEVRLQAALGNDVGPACKDHDPERAAAVRVFAHAVPLPGLTPEQLDTIPAQWVRIVHPPPARKEPS